MQQQAKASLSFKASSFILISPWLAAVLHFAEDGSCIAQIFEFLRLLASVIAIYEGIGVTELVRV